MYSLAAISSWHESNEFLCHDLHIMQLITPDVALPWEVRARVCESLSKYSIKGLLKKRSPRLYYQPTGTDGITAVALSRNTSIILEPFLSKVRRFEIVLSGRSGWLLRTG